jgi:hypothetical protein
MDPTAGEKDRTSDLKCVFAIPGKQTIVHRRQGMNQKTCERSKRREERKFLVQLAGLCTVIGMLTGWILSMDQGEAQPTTGVLRIEQVGEQPVMESLFADTPETRRSATDVVHASRASR